MPDISPAVHKWPIAHLAYVDMKAAANTAQVGDWLVFSGTQVVAAASATAYYRASGVGIALANNPAWNSIGSAYYQSAMPVGVGGTFHVSGVGSATAGYYVWPMDIGSGVVGQTGLTGKAAIWTAVNALPLFSALGGSQISGSGIPGSGVARIMRIVTAANPTAEWEIQLLPPAALGFLAWGGPQG